MGPFRALLARFDRWLDAAAARIPPDGDADRETSRGLDALAEAMLHDPAYADTPWSGLVVVADLDGRESVQGYLYLADGTWVQQAPEGDAVLHKAVALRAAMQAPDQPPWRAALVQLRRMPAIKLNAKFEYDDPDRWRMPSETPEERGEKLRPH